jgi:Ca-activated chloride channel family protein
MRRVLFLLILTTVIASAQAQPPTEPNVPVYKGGTALVRVDVQVLEKGKPVPGLTRDDFVVRDEGVPQPLIAFGRESAPLELLFVLDVSGSMGKVLGEMASVAQKALQALNLDDQVGVVLFSRNARVSLELTSERPLIVRALKEAPLERDLGAGTSLNEAVLAAVDYLKSQPLAGRRALLVLTDNGGLNVKTPDEQVLRALAASDTVLNAIVPPGAKPPAPPAPGVAVNPDYTHSDVFHLAQEAGGEVLRADKPERLREMLEHIRVRYALGYRAPEASPGSWRAIQVELAEPARRRFPKAELHARRGYFVNGG